MILPPLPPLLNIELEKQFLSYRKYNTLFWPLGEKVIFFSFPKTCDKRG